MSKLPNAPLLEVIYELRWPVTKNDDLVNFQYLHGDLYSLMKNKYPDRELLNNPDIPLALSIGNAVYRFRKSKNSYPLFQLGPGLLSLNTSDEFYYWEQFYEWAKELSENFFKVFPNAQKEFFTQRLIYFDFFEISFKDDNILDYLSSRLHISIKQDFFKSEDNPNLLTLNIGYPCQLGELHISVNPGQHHNKKGIVIQTTLTGNAMLPEFSAILNWLDNAHTFCSDLFKELTKGEAYNSFQ